MSSQLGGSAVVFQSTPPHGGRHAATCRAASLNVVSIHAPARGATANGADATTKPALFQSTPPHGGRPVMLGPCRTLIKWFQSTPPHGGRLCVWLSGLGGRVSIHAPARGATRVGSCRPAEQLFQSTPPHGGRLSERAGGAQLSSQFQSTPPHGGRLDFHLVNGVIYETVSIHAPARGATMDLVFEAWGWKVSIHAPARGATGRRRWRWRNGSRFNPRPRTGGDPGPRCRRIAVRVSIHAPARGATVLGHGHVDHGHGVSIHAPARGATTLVPEPYSGFGKFQSTPPHGGRPRRVCSALPA